jgi:hypothetical protein
MQLGGMHNQVTLHMEPQMTHKLTIHQQDSIQAIRSRDGQLCRALHPHRPLVNSDSSGS